MSGPFGSQQWMYGSGDFYSHPIDYSARLDTNSYYTRTPSSSGSRTTWTWNAWVKLGSIGQTEVLFTARTAGQSANGTIGFEAGKLFWDEYDGSSNTLRRHTTQVFRDPSAWYMITIVADTTNATASNRGRVYINGSQVTDFSVSVNPAQSAVLEINQNITHRIGANSNNVQYFNGYIAEVNFVDGQALDPTSFGQNRSGVWIPKRYSGSYGTNGFYLDFGNYGALGATNSGTVIVNDTERGDVASFDGVDDYIQTPFADNFTDFTVSTFFKWESGSGNSIGELISKRSYYAASITDFPFSLHVTSSGYLSAVYSTGNDYSADLTQTSSTALTSGTWYHVAVTYDRDGNSVLYLDGTAIDTDASVSISANSLNWKLGQAALPYSAGVGDSEFKGRMSQFRMYDRALSSSEVTSLYNESGEPEDGLVAHYALDEFLDGFGDQSGNSNDWTTNNVAYTDVMLDSPTNNFPTLNPLYQPLITYSEGNLRTYYGGAYAGAEPTMYTGKNEKYYSEELLVSLGGDRGIAVIADNGTESIGWVYNGNTYGSLAAGFVMPTYTTGDIIGYAIDGTTNQVQFYKNGVAAGSAWQFSTTAPLGFRTHMGYMYGGSDAVANFGQDSSFAGQKTRQGYTDANGIGDFYYQPPSGYLALCTANLPDPVAAIDPALGSNPEDHFNTVLWTGNGTSQSITGVGFESDLIWIKGRSAAEFHTIHDSVRDVTYSLSSASTSAETNTGSARVSNVGADGYDLGNSGNVNGSSTTYVGWNWKAGGTGVSNTDGTITSTVSANVDAGFSIVSYTGNGTQTTTGHGLSAKPDIVIQKRRNAADNWYVFTDLIDGSFDYLILNSTNAKGDATGYATQTASVMATPNWSDAVIAYCFHSVEGFSKIGKYTGNGSTDGPFVYCGFRPAFVIAKPSSTTGNWIMWDNTRDSYNAGERTLFPNSSSAEESGNVNESWDLLSNGFKLKSNGRVNVSGVTYIFMAFAEMPFKYANAR